MLLGSHGGPARGLVLRRLRRRGLRRVELNLHAVTVALVDARHEGGAFLLANLLEGLVLPLRKAQGLDLAPHRLDGDLLHGLLCHRKEDAAHGDAEGVRFVAVGSISSPQVVNLLL